MTQMRLLEGLFGKPDPVPPPPLEQDIRLAENDVRIDRALKETVEVSKELAYLSGTLRVLIEEYRRVRR